MSNATTTERALYPRWEIVLYHDEEEDAATNSISMGRYYESEEAAVAEARSLTLAPPDPYWNGGASVHRGTYYPPRFGVAPSRFDYDESATSLHVWEGEVDE